MTSQSPIPNPQYPPSPQSPIPNPQSPIPNLRIAIWAAVSSKPQAAQDKTSLADQEQAGRQFATALDAHVVHVYTIPGHTRDLIFWSDAEAAMDAYRQLRQDCEAHTFDVLWARDPDRLGRDPALSNQVISLVEKSGAEIYLASAPHPIGQTSTGHRYIYAIQTVRAQEDQRTRVRYSAQGLRARVRRGLPANHWPLGYLPTRNAKGETTGATLDPDTSPAVRLATRLFIAGEPYSHIIQALEASPYHPARAPRWNLSAVQRIMHNDTYAGFPAWDGTTPTAPSPHYPALWDLPTHAAVIRERARRGRPHNRRAKSTGSPLAGVVFCGRCGSTLTRQRHPNRRTYSYRCSKHARSSVTGQPCHNNYVTQRKLYAALTDHLQHLATHPTALDQALATPDTTDHQADILHVDRRLADLDTRRNRLALALAAGHLDPQMYKKTDDLLPPGPAVKPSSPSPPTCPPSSPTPLPPRSAPYYKTPACASSARPAPSPPSPSPSSPNHHLIPVPC
jgi:DNA invertase Pin-like site-specific DNA recombinase